LYVFEIWTTITKDLRHISDDLASEITRSKLETIYREATKYPYNFMVIDKTVQYPSLRYRKCFDYFWT